ncbi:MAG: rRNA maturation RNase YbeY [Lachnospiraceae bacterium]|nr:rRNA maturation RNase YbeY [Lachnospiraceae bacterium]
MNYLIDSDIEFDWGFDHLTLYERAASAVLEAEGCPYEVTVSLYITDDEHIRQINSDMRSIDSATDVLSFPMLEFDAPSDFPSDLDISCFDPESGELILGDIVLSAEHAKMQAGQYMHSLQREYAFLIIHSMLHLCGYDHMEDQDAILMEERQKVILQGLYDDFPELIVS